MRAFSLYFDVLPVIVVNGSDTPRGRLFSLLHEYAHLLLRTGGLCDTVTDLQATTPDRRLEARCNAIAAAILMPAEAVITLPSVVVREGSPGSWDYESLRAAAAPFGVSAEAFLRRLLTLGRVSRAFYQAKRQDFLDAYEHEEVLSGSGGGNWYRTTARDLGKGYVRRVADAHRRRVIDSYTAASYLNVKVEQIPRLAQEAALQVSA
jgi:Zn-dependent peptidase ImmA (M78 family)